MERMNLSFIQGEIRRHVGYRRQGSESPAEPWVTAKLLLIPDTKPCERTCSHQFRH